MTRSDQTAMRSDPRLRLGKSESRRANPGAVPTPAGLPNGDLGGLSFRSFADCTSILIWQSGLDRRCTYFNGAWLAYTGRSLAQEIDGGWLGGVHPDDLDRCVAIYTEAFDARRPFSMEYRLRRAGGDYGWVFVTGAPHITPDGRFAGYIGTAVDVTDRFLDSTKRKHAEEALRESEARYRRIVEAAEEGIWVVDDEWKTTFVNARMARMLRYPADEMLGRHIYDFMHEEGRPLAAGSMQRRVREVHDFCLRRRDGQDLWVIISSNPILDESGRFVGALAMVTDITDRRRAEDAVRQSEARFRGIFEHAGVGIALVAADSSFRRTNPALQRMLGYSAEELLGMSIADITHADDLRLTLDRFAQMVAGECDSYQIVKRYVRKDGRAIWGRLTVSGLPALPPDEGVCIGMVEDITDLRAAEDQARTQQAELARVSRHAVAGEMAAILAHELNQPLAAIANYTQAALQRLRSGPDGHADLLDICSRVDAQARRGAEITRRIASFVRKREPQLSTVDANDLIREILDLAGLIRAGPPGRLRLELAEGLPPVLADRIQIQQVVLNLVRNALEASTSGPHTDNPGGVEGPPVIVRTGSPAPGLVQVAVRDFGPGLAPESVPHIFEPFFTTKPDGMGLGLAISKSIIDAHKGTLSASSNADTGATFSFTLRVPSGPRVSRGARHRAR